jgi:hypothetical protein
LAALRLAGGQETAGQAFRPPGSAPKDTPTIHDPAQLWFAFVEETGR